MIIRTHSYPRAALVGNPSDGFFGKTIAFTFSNFSAEVILYQTPELEILPNTRDHSKFGSIRHLVEDVNLYGYYGGIRLLKATVKKFFQYCETSGIGLDDRNFTIRYSSDIPHGLGLAGSSAIITACMRALLAFFAIDIPKPVLANIVLSVETEELGIAAGLQDRVAQVYQGIVYMDFDKKLMDAQGYGSYEYIDNSLLSNIYIAFRSDLAEVSEKVHKKYRQSYEKHSQEFQDAVKRWAELTVKVREAIEAGRIAEVGPLLNENFDIRNKVSTVSSGNLEMVRTARSLGVSAKFTGSGGAIIGTYEDEDMLEGLRTGLADLGIEVMIPEITQPPL